MIYIKNKTATPDTAIMAPSISLILIFSLNNTIENGIIMIGDIEEIVAAIPAVVY